MSAKDRTLPKFAVGSQVRLKKGVFSRRSSGGSLAGWLGIVSQVSGVNYLIHWNGATLEAVDSSYRQQCERDGVDFDTAWLREWELEAVPGAPSCCDRGERVAVGR
jgi:hypothetical protein